MHAGEPHWKQGIAHEQLRALRASTHVGQPLGILVGLQESSSTQWCRSTRRLTMILLEAEMTRG